MGVKDFKFSMKYMAYASDVILMVAIALGLFDQWQYSHNTYVLIIAILGLFVFGISCALQFYFQYVAFGQALLHIWLGCLLGVITFSTNQTEIKFVMTQEVMDILLLSSLAVSCFWSVIERMMHLVKYEAVLFKTMELLESVGMCVATLVTGQDAASISLFIVSLLCHLAAVRMKSVLGLLSFIGMIAIATRFCIDLTLPINVYGLVCFVGRLSIPPILDLYFSELTTLERWQAVFNQRRIVRHLSLIMIFLLNITLGILVGKQMTKHKEWYVVIPIFIVFSIVWLCFHFIFLITCWKLTSKITECNMVYHSMSDERRSLSRILASKGVRHFSLVSHRLICVTIVTSLGLLGLGWTTRTGYSQALLFIILPIECMTLSLFRELGAYLGGTAIGYAIISPATGQRPGTGVTLFSPSNVQEIGSYATATLNKVCQFFDFHMIDNFGSDFSSSGMSLEFLASKVKSFFGRCSLSDSGPRYDTYLLYFSGDVYDSGDWALADNRNLKFDTLLEWWSEKNQFSGARLILILDSLHSHLWIRDLKYVRGQYVAVQTCRYEQNKKDLELGVKLPVGTFSQDWVHYNMEADLELSWSNKDRSVKALFGLSKYWPDFTFHMPTEADIAHHCDTSFPKVLKSLIQLVNYRGFLCRGGLCFCCNTVTRCLKRKRMRWLTPKEIDTKHGFKLVRS